MQDEAVADLLGLMACGELLGFERLAHDATLAPSIEGKAELARMAVAEFHHRTAASNWLESLIKAFVGDSLAAEREALTALILGGGLDP